MLTRYIQQAMKRARYKLLEDASYFGEIPVSLESGLMNVRWMDAGQRCRKF
jgi:hypothetical protein